VNAVDEVLDKALAKTPGDHIHLGAWYSRCTVLL